MKFSNEEATHFNVLLFIKYQYCTHWTIPKINNKYFFKKFSFFKTVILFNLLVILSTEMCQKCKFSIAFIYLKVFLKQVFSLHQQTVS